MDIRKIKKLIELLEESGIDKDEFVGLDYFGLVPFFDAGRVWADSTPQPELDGQGLGLKYGAGGGLRLQSGSSFLLRLDVAASPDASPVSGYFSAGQIFDQ